MLFMLIFEYSPENRNVLIKKYVEKGPMIPDGIKEVGMWSSVSGGRVYSIYETDDPAALAKFGQNWNDLGTGEIIPVMKTVEYIKLVAGGW